MPKVSVIIPTYNRKAFVQQAIDSVLAQTHANHEIIVVDDGSTDGTAEALAARYGSLITLLRQQNQGPAVGRNRGLAAASGKYVGFLDDDDIYLPRMLAETLAFLEKNPKVGMVCVQGYLMTPNGELTGKTSRRRMTDGYVDAEELLFQRPPLPSNSVIRGEVLNEIGWFDTTLEFGEDGDLYYRILSNWPIYFIAKPLMAFRQGNDKRSGQMLNPDKARWWYEQSLKGYLKLEDMDLFKPLLPRALAQEKTRLAMNRIANGDGDEVERLLADAFAIESSPWFYEEVMRRHFLMYMEALDEQRGIEPALAFADRFFRIVWDTNAFQPEWKKRLLGEFHLTRFFRKAAQRDWAAMRFSYGRTFYFEPKHLRNRGMHSLYFRSFFTGPDRPDQFVPSGENL